MLNIKMGWMPWTKGNSQAVIMFEDKFFIVLLVQRPDEPSTIEKTKILNNVLRHYHKFIKNPKRVAEAEVSNVIKVAYYWNWEKDEESGGIRTFYEYPSYDEISAMRHYKPEEIEIILPALKEVFSNE